MKELSNYPRELNFMLTENKDLLDQMQILKVLR